MKVFDTILQNGETKEEVKEWVNGIDWTEIDIVDENIKYKQYIGTINGVKIYYDYGADYYFFAPAEESNFEIVNRSKTIDKKKEEVENFNEELKKYLKDTENSYLVGGSFYFGDTFCIKPLEIKDTKNGFLVYVYTKDIYSKDWTKDKYLITTKKENGKTIVWGWSDENSDYMEGGFAKPFAELKRCLKKSIGNFNEGADFSMGKGYGNFGILMF